MYLATIGLNHRTSPLALRERMVVDSANIGEALRDLQQNHAHEVAILSTCNRTEIYCVLETHEQLDLTQHWLSKHQRVEWQVLEKCLYAMQSEAAVRHVFRVAAGLDSMVLGEPQILGQIKAAARAAQTAGTLGSYLHHLFQRSFHVAKAVRASTAIGTQSVSMAAIAVRVAQRIFPSLKELRVLLIGAGEIIQLCGTHFKAQSPKQITVANRTIERAQILATRWQAETLKLTEIPSHIDQYDIVISCTASHLPIIGKGLLERTIKQRRYKPQLLIDLAIPRDIEPEAAEINGIYLYTLDDLGALAESGVATRHSAIEQANSIVENGVLSFNHWLEQRNRIPLIKEMRYQAEEIRKNEIKKAMKALRQGVPAEKILEHLSSSLVNHLLHHPTVALQNEEKHSTTNQNHQESLRDWISRLYRLSQNR